MTFYDKTFYFYGGLELLAPTILFDTMQNQFLCTVLALELNSMILYRCATLSYSYIRKIFLLYLL